MSMREFYKDGIQFKCAGSGKCCTSRGEYGYVYLTLADRRRMAKQLGVATQSFTKKYCKLTGGVYHLIEDPNSPDCMFLQDNRCSIYQARPTQCRTWPFWPENMNAKSWKRDVVKFCPGAKKSQKKSADLVSATKIEIQVNEQARAEYELFGEPIGK